MARIQAGSAKNLYQSRMNNPATRIPAFGLYGEAEGLPDLCHVETLADRAAPLDWEIAIHRHDALSQLLLMENGGGWAEVDGARHALRSGTVVFVPRLCAHGFAFEPGSEGMVITFPQATLAAALGARTPPELARPWLGPAEPELREALRQIADEHRAQRSLRAPVLTGLIGLCLLRVARAAEDGGDPVPQGPYEALVAGFLALLDARFREEKRVAAYAGALGRTASHLNRACRAVLGRSASRVIRQRVMMEARRELAYTLRPVSEIGWSLGFDDPAHFAKAFRQETGQSPRAFRAGVLG